MLGRRNGASRFVTSKRGPADEIAVAVPDLLRLEPAALRISLRNNRRHSAIQDNLRLHRLVAIIPEIRVLPARRAEDAPKKRPRNAFEGG